MGYHSALVSEDLTLGSKSHSRNTDVSARSKTTRKPPRDSGSVSRKPKSSETLWDSMDDDSTGLWIASLRAGRASLIPSPASGSELQTSAGSGATSPESSMKPEPLYSSAKTFPDSCETPTGHPIAIWNPEIQNWTTTQQTLLGEWEPFSGIWPRWGLCLHGEVFEQPKWEPATGVRESSCWPTAVRQDGSDSVKHTTMTGVMHAGTMLTDAVREWKPSARPTARAEDSESTGAHRGKADTLSSAVDRWSTPNAHDATGQRGPGFTLTDNHYFPHDLATEAELWRSPDAPKARGVRTHTTSQGHGDQITIAEQAEMWMTPNVQNGGRKMTPEDAANKGATAKGKRQVGLENQAEFWASPQARDWRRGETVQEYGNSRPLSEQVTEWLPPHGLTYAPEKGGPGGGGEFAEQAARWKPPQNWPTPDTMGFLDGDAVRTKADRANKNTQHGESLHHTAYRFSPPVPPIRLGLTFSQRVRILLPLCRQLRNSLPTPYNKSGCFKDGKWQRAAMFKRKLNPDFTDWLMGWPVGWSSGLENADLDSNAVVTALSRFRAQLYSLCSRED